jgi:hypothetical protein
LIGPWHRLALAALLAGCGRGQAGGAGGDDVERDAVAARVDGGSADGSPTRDGQPPMDAAPGPGDGGPEPRDAMPLPGDGDVPPLADAAVRDATTTPDGGEVPPADGGAGAGRPAGYHLVRFSIRGVSSGGAQRVRAAGATWRISGVLRP